MISFDRRRSLERARLHLKSELNRFWIHCPIFGAARLARLKEFATIIISGREGRSQRRTSFANRGKKCFACPRPARVRHHVIQLQNGGDNSKENRVSLCEECHSEIHPWLKEAIAGDSVNNSVS